jgi:hypothetical protein
MKGAPVSVSVFDGFGFDPMVHVHGTVVVCPLGPFAAQITRFLTWGPSVHHAAVKLPGRAHVGCLVGGCQAANSVRFIIVVGHMRWLESVPWAGIRATGACVNALFGGRAVSHPVIFARLHRRLDAYFPTQTPGFKRVSATVAARVGRSILHLVVVIVTFYGWVSWVIKWPKIILQARFSNRAVRLLLVPVIRELVYGTIPIFPGTFDRLGLLPARVLAHHSIVVLNVVLAFIVIHAVHFKIIVEWKRFLLVLFFARVAVRAAGLCRRAPETIVGFAVYNL